MIGKAVVTDHHQQLSVLFCRRLHLFGFNRVDGVGLFAQDVEPCVERVNRNDRVQIVRSTNIHRIKPLKLQYVMIIGEILRDPVCLGKRLGC